MYKNNIYNLTNNNGDLFLKVKMNKRNLCFMD